MGVIIVDIVKLLVSAVWFAPLYALADEMFQCSHSVGLATTAFNYALNFSYNMQLRLAFKLDSLYLFVDVMLACKIFGTHESSILGDILPPRCCSCGFQHLVSFGTRLQSII